jgi:hypothetical protein
MRNAPAANVLVVYEILHSESLYVPTSPAAKARTSQLVAHPVSLFVVVHHLRLAAWIRSRVLNAR